MDRNSYALGMSIAHNMLSSGVKDIAFDDFAAGLSFWTSISQKSRRSRRRRRQP